jgi:hypothetical protein
MDDYGESLSLSLQEPHFLEATFLSGSRLGMRIELGGSAVVETRNKMAERLMTDSYQ